MPIQRVDLPLHLVLFDAPHFQNMPECPETNGTVETIEKTEDQNERKRRDKSKSITTQVIPEPKLGPLQDMFNRNRAKKKREELVDEAGMSYWNCC